MGKVARSSHPTSHDSHPHRASRFPLASRPISCRSSLASALPQSPRVHVAPLSLLQLRPSPSRPLCARWAASAAIFTGQRLPAWIRLVRISSPTEPFLPPCRPWARQRGLSPPDHPAAERRMLRRGGRPKGGHGTFADLEDCVVVADGGYEYINCFLILCSTVPPPLPHHWKLPRSISFGYKIEIRLHNSKLTKRVHRGAR